MSYHIQDKGWDRFWVICNSKTIAKVKGWAKARQLRDELNITAQTMETIKAIFITALNKE